MSASDKDPSSGFFNSLLGFPSAVYQRGSDHGREWSRMYRGEESEHERPHDSRQHPYRRSTGGRSYAMGGDDNNDNDDWIKRVAKDIEHNEAMARGLYMSWKQEEETQQARSKEDETTNHCDREGRRSRWWGSRCHGRRSTSDSGCAAQPSAIGSHDSYNACMDLDKEQKHIQDDVNQLVRQADEWRKQWLEDDKLWPTTDLFGKDTPFAKPLSSLFALSMAPAFLRFEPDSHPIGYVLYSPYSPLALENTEGFDKSWRNRFEDLLRAEGGMDLMRPEEAESTTTTSGMFWVTKRVVPLLWKSKEQSDFGRAENGGSAWRQTREAFNQRAADEPATEQDMFEGYHKFFGDMPREAVDHPAAAAQRFETKGTQPKPDILSTLTTTEQNTAPDGTITTKTTQKRRFSNGHEETETKTEIKNGDGALASAAMRQWPRTEQRRPQQPAAKAPKQAREEQKPPQRGWFWSS